MGWVDKTSNTYWTASTGSWDRSAWDSEYSGYEKITLSPTGGWESSYRPTHVRIALTLATAFFLIVDQGGIVVDTDYNSHDEVVMNWSDGVDISSLEIINEYPPESSFSITKIEFYEGDEERGDTSVAGVVSSECHWLNSQGGISEAGAASSETHWLNVQGETSEAGTATTSGVYREITRGETSEAGAKTDGGTFNYSSWLAENGKRYSLFYEVTLTGSEDGETDLILPSKSFQARLRSGDPTYLSVIVPDVATYAAAITARANGQLYVESVAYVNGVESLREEIIRVDLESIRTDQGATEQSVTLSGHLTETYGENNAPLQNVMVRTLQADGKLSFRCATPDFYLKPGNIATYKTDSFTVGLVTYMVSVATQYMIVTEA